MVGEVEVAVVEVVAALFDKVGHLSGNYRS